MVNIVERAKYKGVQCCKTNFDEGHKTIHQLKMPKHPGVISLTSGNPFYALCPHIRLLHHHTYTLHITKHTIFTTANC